MNKKTPDKITNIYLNILSKIIGFGTLIITAITISYLLIKLPVNEIKAAIVYYYSETLVIEGKYEKLVNFTSESGIDILLPAAQIISNPLIMLSKQQFNWALIKGIFIGYVSFKIFCISFLVWIYFRKKKSQI